VKKAFALLAFIASLSLTCAVMAQQPTTKPAKGLRGKVESVDGLIITIKNKNGEASVTTDANTTFTLDGNPATLADVKAGERLVAIPADGVATEVKLMSGGKKKKAATEPTTAPN
jgi:phosphate-selective porin